MNIGEIYFNKYKIIEMIGQGGTSEVYLAENVKLGNNFAIKKAKKDTNSINLLAEPNILKHLNHPAIPKIIDIEEDSEAIYLIEEFIEGTHLKSYKCIHETIEEAELIDFGLQICDVLKYLHHRQPPIIYRDLKPENIIVDQNNRLKIIDFGIAREYKADSTSDTVPIGTKGYAAPEQYGICQSDERTDIFSLGMTLYYLLTNRNLTNPPYKIQITEKLNQSISTELISVIIKCCEILPSKRYQSVEEVDVALRALLKKDGYAYQNSDTEMSVEEAAVSYMEESISQEAFEEPMKEKESQINRRRKSTIVIGLLGVQHSAGVTHSAILIAEVLAKRHSVALIEQNNSGHFQEIGLIVDHENNIRKKNFKYHKIHYLWDQDIHEVYIRHRDQFDYLVIDFGAYDELVEISEFIRCDIPVVIAQGIDWKVRELKEFIDKTNRFDPLKKWKYIVPLLDVSAVKGIGKEIDHKLVAFPYNMNPFSPEGSIKKIIEGIIGQE